MTERGRDTAHVGRHHRQSSGLSLEEHLGQPLGERHVEESVAPLVQIEEGVAVWDVAREREIVDDAELRRPRRDGRGELALSDRHEAPGSARVAEAREDLGQEKRILLVIEPPDAQQLELTAPVLPDHVLGGCDSRAPDERDADDVNAAVSGAAVLPAERLADDDRGKTPREQPEDVVERMGGRDGPKPAAARETTRDVCRKILADPENDRNAARAGESDELERDRVRAEDPNRIELLELGRERAPRAGDASEQGPD